MGLTTNISTNTTNDLHYSFLRNYWQWERAGDPTQIVHTGRRSSRNFSGQGYGQVNDLGPYNVDTQNTRNRFWDGHDSDAARRCLHAPKGNHLFTFGGIYEHNWDYHQRTDNGGGINNQFVYEAWQWDHRFGSRKQIYHFAPSPASPSPIAALSAQRSRHRFNRTGCLYPLRHESELNPLGSPAFDKSTIPYYNVYFSDTWHMKPTFTLTYGLGWTLEMPPVEANRQAGGTGGLVRPANFHGVAYLAARKRAALQGQIYNPEIGFALLGNVGNGQKYPYNPFYGEFSPRIAAAWSPRI